MRRRDRWSSWPSRSAAATLDGRRVAVLGAAFKPSSDDVRDSPALDVAARLHARGATVTVYDPQANARAAALCPVLDYAESAVGAAAAADLVLVLTDWPEFCLLDPQSLAPVVRRRRLLDGRSALDPDRWRAAGWSYRSLGRP